MDEAWTQAAYGAAMLLIGYWYHSEAGPVWGLPLIVLGIIIGSELGYRR